MFSIVKQQVDLVELISRDTGLIFKESGTNYVIEDDVSTEGCPFCNHHDCFRIKHSAGDNENSMYKCFSCGEYGDAIKWTEKRCNISAKDAALKLAKEFGIDIPNDYSPMQEVFNLAARYYENCFWEVCNHGYPELGGLTPLEYQKQIRHHSEAVLKRMQVGWSDGRLMEYLSGLGFDDELLEQSGLKARKSSKDFLPTRCFIYPHKVKGRVSHWTFKDPSKRLAYQLPKKNSLNNYVFYNQDSVNHADTVVVVEGENDLISVLDTGKVSGLVATIGQLSGEQLDWLRNNCGDKNILTIFDPDDAGDKYRVKVEKLRRYFKNLAHIKPPEELDVDEYLCKKGTIEELVKNYRVEVSLEEEKATQETLPIEWSNSKEPSKAPSLEPSVSGDQKFKDTLAQNGLSTPGQSTAAASHTEVDDDQEVQSGNVIQRKGAYWRQTFKDGVPEYIQISDFIMKLKNVYLSEDGDRHREIVVVRDNGFVSDPFLIDSETKVNEKPFRVLMAKVADGTFLGNSKDLAEIWRLVSKQVPDVLVRVPRTVGRMNRMNGFLFRNAFISDTGVVTAPDEDGIFWMHGRSIGIRPESLNQKSALDSDRRDIPFIEINVSAEEADGIMKQVVHQLSRNLTGPGLALIALGWTKMNLYADSVFQLNKGVPQLFLWGTNGKGKTTVAKWLQDFYGMRDHGSTSVPMLKSGVGWSRKSEYYSCLPLMIDEIRSNDETKQYLGTFRSYYDREGRTMGTADGFGVRTTTIRSCFIFVGEDQFEDPATRERCIPIRIPANGRELVESYRWMEDHRHLFTGVMYHWIMEYCKTDLSKLQSRIRELDKELVSAGCPQRTSKNWAAIGVFGIELAEKYMPEFDFKKYLTEACQTESQFQKSDTTLMQFWELVEAVMAKDNSPINTNHIMLDNDNKHLYVWYNYVYKAVADDQRGRFTFSKNAVLSAIREEPYFVSDDKRRQLGMDNTRPRVLTIDITQAPDVVKNIAKAM
ncbi:MAG TPA: CHC2 zinc finger domain-containing protein [Methanosarcina sp.]|nr:CHC2 zinc finger domain-containing protein [Methanosarcina sp.]